MGASRLRIDEFESDGNIKSGELEGIDLLFVKSTDLRCLSRHTLHTAKPIGNMYPLRV